MTRYDIGLGSSKGARSSRAVLPASVNKTLCVCERKGTATGRPLGPSVDNVRVSCRLHVCDSVVDVYVYVYVSVYVYDAYICIYTHACCML